MIDTSVITTYNLEETLWWAKIIGSKLKKGDVIGLIGALGSGKTCFVKGLAEGLGIPKEEYVTSPTFTIINEYKGIISLYHFDLYRIDTIKDLLDIGYNEYFSGEGVIVIEWAEKILKWLPKELLIVKIKCTNDKERTFIFTGQGTRYRELLGEIEEIRKNYFNFSKFLEREVYNQRWH